MQMKDGKVATVDKGGHVPHLPPPDDQLAHTGGEEKGLRLADPLALLDMAQEGNSQGGTVEAGNAPVRAGDIEMGISAPTSTVETGRSSTGTASKESKLKHDLKLSVLLITISMIPLIDTLFLHGPTVKLNLTLKLTAFFAFTPFISATCLMFNTFKVMATKPASLLQSQLMASKILLAIAAASLFSTCMSITYSLMPQGYYFLPLALLPSLPVAGFHYFLYRAETDGHGEIETAKIKSLKKDLKRATQLTLSLVSTSFSGFVGVLLGIYHKTATLGAAYSYTKVSVYLLLGGGVAGTFALLLCRLLSSSDGCDQRSKTTWHWQRAMLAAANIVMIAMLVPWILMIAETIVHGLLAGAAFPVLAGASAWLLVEFCTAAGGAAGGSTEEKEDGKAAAALGAMYSVAVAVASVSSGAIVAIFGGLLGGAVGKEQLKACTFLLASAFAAAVSLGLLTSVTAARAGKRKASAEFAATVLACYGLGSLVLAALALFYQIAA